MRSDAPRRPERSFTLPDRYRLRRHIASGGMASVWCADDLVLDRSVAIKVLAERFAHDGLAVARFKREARAAARVSGHPHVVTVYDVGELPSDEAAIDTTHSTDRGFIVMEHLAGGTVADAIRHDSVRRHEAMRWLHEAASALDHAHANGIVHRDIKPANFLLDRARVLHVADFGIARLTTEETITSSDQLFGTAAYLSPEQALGREATGASDRYALAVCAFELLAGERPFSAPHFSAQARQHIEEPPPAASEIDRSLPPAVDEVLFAGLAKDPAARPQTAGEFVGALADALAGRWPENLSGAGPRGARSERTNFSTGRRGASRSPDPAAPAASTAAARRHNDTRSPATRGPSSSHARRTPSRARLLALGMVAVAVLVLAGIAAAALGGHGNANTRLADAHTPTTHSTASHTATRASTTHHRTAPARTSTSTSASTPAAQTASQLETTGHAEMLNGDYTSAISTLKQAVSTAPTDSLTYAYALYDLGRSELEAGEPQAAIAILRQRLKIPNQRGVVKALLDQAIASANAPATSDPTPTTPTTTNAAPPANAGTPGGSGSGGGGLGNGGTPPGQAKKGAGDSRGGRGRGLVRIITAAVGS